MLDVTSAVATVVHAGAATRRMAVVMSAVTVDAATAFAVIPVGVVDRSAEQAAEQVAAEAH